MDKQNFVEKMDEFTKKRSPYLFVVDFEFNTPEIYPLNMLPKGIMFDVSGIKNYRNTDLVDSKITLEKIPPSFDLYKKSFDQVVGQINKGNSYLVNLTWPTKVQSNAELEDIFYKSSALFKLYFKGKFVVFSPERFVRIEKGEIYAFPMKGTIDASIPDAEKLILNNRKEQAEHATIVDLIRNDLSIVAKNVTVPEYRFISPIQTNNKNLLQVSSKVRGTIKNNYTECFGTLFSKILPAGSISGAPKKKTVEIIKEAEPDNRGFYTGVFGIFDGNILDCGVMIRYIEKTKVGFLYRSGGGITAQSKCEDEYNELLDKIYVPVS